MIPAFLIKKFGETGAKLVFFGSIAAILLAMVTGFVLYERHVGATGEVVKEQGRTIKVQEQAGEANGNAAAARVEGATRLEQQKTELKDAVNNATSPDDLRHRRGCAILRQQGRSKDAATAGC